MRWSRFKCSRQFGRPSDVDGLSPADDCFGAKGRNHPPRCSLSVSEIPKLPESVGQERTLMHFDLGW